MDIYSFLTIQIEASRDEIYIYRNVVTFVDCLSSIGGLFNILLLVAKLSSKLYSVPLYQKEIIS